MDKTIEQVTREFLGNNGLLPDQVNEVFALVVKDESMKLVIGRWSDRVSDYGEAPISNIVIEMVRVIALRYIDENIPEAWFRAMFLPLEQQRKLMESR